MDRQIVYIAQTPQDTDILLTNLHSYIAFSKFAAAVFGTGTLLNAFTCTPTSPASLTVNVAPGEIYSLQVVDSGAYGSLPSNSTPILKQGIITTTTNLSCPAPTTPGDSINYLIQIGFSETDGGSTILPYYNSTNSNVPFTGPNNAGTPQNTIRTDGVNIQVKAGTQATTGTQVTPSPDAGFTAAYVVTVDYGETTITSPDITIYPAAPFLTMTLPQLLQGNYIYAADTGAANAYVITLTQTPGSYSAGLSYAVKINNTNTSTSCTLNVNGLSAKNIKLVNGNNPSVGDLLLGGISFLVYDGTNFQLTNPVTYFIAPQPVEKHNYLYNTQSRLMQRINPASPTTVSNNTYGDDRWKTLTQTASIQISRTNAFGGPAGYGAAVKQTQATPQRWGRIQFLEYAECQQFLSQNLIFIFSCSSATSSLSLFGQILAWTGTLDSPTTNVVNNWTSTTYTPGNFYISNITPVNATPVSINVPTSGTSQCVVTGVAPASLNNLAVFIWTNGTIAQNVTINVSAYGLYMSNTTPVWTPESPALELSRCQRFYEKSFAIDTQPAQNAGTTNSILSTLDVSGNTQGTFIPSRFYKQTKRVSPTVTIYNPSAANAQVRDVTASADFLASTPTTGTNSYYITGVTNSSGTFTVADELLWHDSADADF